MKKIETLFIKNYILISVNKFYSTNISQDLKEAQNLFITYASLSISVLDNFEIASKAEKSDLLTFTQAIFTSLLDTINSRTPLSDDGDMELVSMGLESLRLLENHLKIETEDSTLLILSSKYPEVFHGLALYIAQRI